MLIDGDEAASESRIIPHDITLTGILEHDGVRHTVVARSTVHFPSAEDSVEVDGRALNLTKT